MLVIGFNCKIVRNLQSFYYKLIPTSICIFALWCTTSLLNVVLYAKISSIKVNSDNNGCFLLNSFIAILCITEIASAHATYTLV